MSQPLHPITALEYASVVRDARRTKIFYLAPDHWLIANSGKLKTLRIPADAGIPDLHLCKGVSGYKTEGSVTYIHTTGEARTELKLADALTFDPDHLRLVDSSAGVQFHELNPMHALFQVKGWDTVQVTFGGIRPGAYVDIHQNKENGRLKADANGLLKLSLPAHSTVALTIQRPPYAAAN
jgi:hypothetical protein